jgi:hypothetical protein
MIGYKPYCGICGEFKPLERNGNCGTCNALSRKSGRVKVSDNGKAINRLSEKGKDVEKKYLNRLRTWKKGKKCAGNFKHDCSDVIECHHMHGRSNDRFFDEWAEENGVVLTLDERFWLPLCSDAHRVVTNDSKFAWGNQYSFKRITDNLFIKH